MTRTHQANSKSLLYQWLSYLLVISAEQMIEPVSSGWSMLSNWAMPPFLNTCAVLSWAIVIRVHDLSNKGGFHSSTTRWHGKRSRLSWCCVGGLLVRTDRSKRMSPAALQFTRPLWPHLVYYSSLQYLKLVCWQKKVLKISIPHRVDQSVFC